jgi:probable rRNA maturation factor
MNQLLLTDRQKTRRLDRAFFRRVARGFLNHLSGVTRHELAVHFLGDDEMASLNEAFLQHEGPTDVITFDHSSGPFQGALHGEIFICVDEAVRNARRFRTNWQAEVIRYFVHGCLHLLGHDDKPPAARKRMKQAENLSLRRLAAGFPLKQLERPPRRG